MFAYNHTARRPPSWTLDVTEKTMTEQRPPLAATLEWDGEEQFTGFIGKHEVAMDGQADAAVTPVQMLALAVSGCMAIDLVHILTRGRHAPTSLKAAFEGERAETPPRRFVRIRLHFTLAGPMTSEHVERALQLSRDKYCSVWASMNPDIALETTFEIA
jgi:putative redox protein